jgi:hypothetical protein
MRRGSITLHATTIPREAEDVLGAVQKRLARIPLPRVRSNHDVFVCEDDWRWSLFTLHDTRSAALCRAPFPGDVLVRDADFIGNRYRKADGSLSSHEQSLEYLLTHELTHAIVADYLGMRRSRALPVWLREGYADYVAGGSLERGRYAAYTRRVSQLLTRDGWSLVQLLENPPDFSASRAP